MMDVAYFRQLYGYNYWARDRVLAAAAKLSQDEYVRENGFTYGSVRRILLHTAWAEAAWLARWTGRPRVPTFEPAAMRDLPLLLQRWVIEEASMREFIAALTDEALQTSRVTYKSSRTGKEYTDHLWQLLAHVVNHGTQHRAEAAEALTIAGHSPGDLDLLDWFRERGERA